MFNFKKNQILAIVFFAILSVSLFAGVYLSQKRQDIRPRAGASTVSLQLFPTTEYFTVGGEKVFELKAVFTGGTATEKIDYLKTDLTFSNQFLLVPTGKYVDTAMSGLTKIFRVDGPVAANEAGKIIIELGAQTPGSGPATDKPITIAKIYFSGKANTTSVQNIAIGASQVVNNQAAEITATTAGTNYIVGQSNITITPAPTCIPMPPDCGNTLPGGSIIVCSPPPGGYCPRSTGKANFLIVSDLNSATVGQNIKTTVSLQITDPKVKVSGVDFLLLYDKEKLDVGNIVPNITSIDPKAPFTDAPIVTSGGSFDDTFNFVRVSLITRRPSSELVGGTIKLADIVFRGRGVGSATIKFPEDNKNLEVVGFGLTSTSNCCNASQSASGYQCIQDCGPPVGREGDPPPGYSCLSPQQVTSRNEFSCPICLASNTKITTPTGEKLVSQLQIGDLVWTLDKDGKKITQPVIQTSKINVPSTHKVSHLVLLDGREAWISPGHPTSDGRIVGDLKAGDSYDGSTIKQNNLVSYWDSATYDILPAGSTGNYWANGILVGSTLKN